VEEAKRKVDLKNRLERLFKDEDFDTLFMREYLKTTAYEVLYREGISDGSRRVLDARKVFHDFLYDIIESGKLAEEQLKGN